MEPRRAYADARATQRPEITGGHSSRPSGPVSCIFLAQPEEL